MPTRSIFRTVSLALPTYAVAASVSFAEAPFPIPDTMQSACYDATREIGCPAPGEPFYGQDAQHLGPQQSYTDNGDGTVTDEVTGLIWVQSPDLNGDGVIDIDDKLTYEEALAGAETFELGGYDDWRLPTITEMYSLMNFNGIDPSGLEGDDSSAIRPFIDTTVFDFGYGDTEAGERLIDGQLASSTRYVWNTMHGQDETLFGVNFADGRIKGYGLTLRGQPKEFYVMYVRGPVGYGVPDLADNGDGTVTNAATGLMWAQADNGEAISWEDALAWAEAMNAADYLGYDDWRVPNVKELQGLVEYTRSPDTTGSAALDPVFRISEIINEAGEPDYPFHWSSTTHANFTDHPGTFAAYVSFGRAMGYMNGWTDVHGAGAQRSDPKVGDAANYPKGNGPQGDAIRVLNHVRLVRDAD
ncbi:DUF1566 domain-containing protein [Thalassococcus sp. CAU 1522]|uniref:DUF1566 domain-containing protein n=1 Tax=Thalassococcus arenae TaxID=2851652 RepID=A0ABS6NBV6_9RHOB|nr:DUF1566 domain-containing protein [Thalassococcus arenae]MBV2361506.1 DUF1566 domain-containing protein [Thalassococcus arenae]